jgi:hypothetical protein
LFDTEPLREGFIAEQFLPVMKSIWRIMHMHVDDIHGEKEDGTTRGTIDEASRMTA